MDQRMIDRTVRDVFDDRRAGIELLGGLVGDGRLDNVLGLKHRFSRVRLEPDDTVVSGSTV
jgi:hypothetical protein